MSLWTALERRLRGKVLLDAPMANYTTWRIGGPADCLVLPADAADISACLAFGKEQGIPVLVIGNGSNLLVLDGGIRGIVVRIGEGMSNFRVEGNRITAQPGLILAKLAREASKRGLTGLSWAAGIPASLGGAALMNAGAFGHSFYEIVERVTVFDQDLHLHTIARENLTYGYRRTSLQENGYVVVEIVLGLRPGDPKVLMEEVEAKLACRREKQPLEYPSCGSVFKNPPGDHAGRLVEACGLRGYGQGGAAVSQKHGNFIVNLNKATAADVLAVMAHVRATVKDRFGLELEPEVKIIGETK